MLAEGEGVSKVLVAQHEAFKGYLPGVCVCMCVCMCMCMPTPMYVCTHRGTHSSDSRSAQTVQLLTHLGWSWRLWKGIHCVHNYIQWNTSLN